MSFEQLTKRKVHEYWMDTPLTRIPVLGPVLTPDATGNALKSIGDEWCDMRFAKYLGVHEGAYVVLVYEGDSDNIEGGEKYDKFEHLVERWDVD